jgi:hypothetical protein
MHYYFENDARRQFPNYLAMSEPRCKNVNTPEMFKKSAEVGEPGNAQSSERRQKHA